MILQAPEAMNYMEKLVARLKQLREKASQINGYDQTSAYDARNILDYIQKVDSASYADLYTRIHRTAMSIIESGIQSTESEMKDIMNGEHVVINSKNPDYSLLQK